MGEVPWFVNAMPLGSMRESHFDVVENKTKPRVTRQARGGSGVMGSCAAGHHSRRGMVGDGHRTAAKSPRIPAGVCWLHHTGAGAASPQRSNRDSGEAWFLSSSATLADTLGWDGKR